MAVSIMVEWEHQHAEFEEPAGYRLYMDGRQVCDIDVPTARILTCHLDPAGDRATFTLAAYYPDGSESPHSEPYDLVFRGQDFDEMQFSATPVLGAAPLEVFFSVHGSMDQNAEYHWSFGDGGTAKGLEVSHTYTTPGTYRPMMNMEFAPSALETIGGPTVTVSSGAGDAQNIEAKINPENIAGLVAVPIALDGLGSYASAGAIQGWHWDFGDGVTGSGAEISHRFNSAGLYTVRLDVVDSQGFTAQATATATISASPEPSPPAPPPTAAIDVSTTRGEVKLHVVFSGAASSAFAGQIESYTWNFGDGTTASGAQTTNTYHVPGRYTVLLEVKDSFGTVGQAERIIHAEDTSHMSPPEAIPTLSEWGLIILAGLMMLMAAISMRRVRTNTQ